MRKVCSRKGKSMNAATFVDSAGKLASYLVAREMRGPGDVDNAMRRLEARYGVPYQALWNLRYRRPKEIAAHVYAGLSQPMTPNASNRRSALNTKEPSRKPRARLARLLFARLLLLLARMTSR
jgi:hypothetical protein